MQETPVQFLDQEDPLEKGWATLSSLLGALLIAQLVKNLPAMQEALVQFLGWKDLLEKGKKHSSILAWATKSWTGLSNFHFFGFPISPDGKESACNAGDPGSIPGSGRSPGEGNGNALRYSCLENPMDGGPWWVTPHGVTKG